MARIGLIDFGKTPNLALLKISSWHKAQGDSVVLGNFLPEQVDKTYVAVVFAKDRNKASRLADIYPNVIFGGTGWDLDSQLPPEIERMAPDYDLYTAEEIYKRICRGIGTREGKMKKAQVLVESAIGFSSRGCPRTCGHCVVPKKEGRLHQVASIGELVRPGSPYLILLDNNLLADNSVLAKLHEIRDRRLIVDISQGIDARLVTPEIAMALADCRHMRSLHCAWDQIGAEKSVMNGIELLKRYINKRNLMCFVLTGFNTTPDEDDYRFHRLVEAGVDPFIMPYRDPLCSEEKKPTTFNEIRLRHFARYVNARIYRVCPHFEEYLPWKKAKGKMGSDGFGIPSDLPFERAC